MLGPSRAGGQRRGIPLRKLGQLVAALAACVVCAVSASDCGFPPYDFGQAGGAAARGGSAGTAGDSGAVGSGGAGARGGAAGNTAGGGQGGGGTGTGGHGGGGTAGQAGIAGQAGEAGAAGVGCVFPPPVAFLAHCFNGGMDSDETASDCGGSCAPCSGTQACRINSDCASNTCVSSKCSQSVNLAYQNVVSEVFTSTPKFNLVLTYLEHTPLPLGDLRVRYYFNHHGVAEPVIALHTQAQLNTGNSQPDISRDMRSQVYRLPPGPTDARGIVTDSYLEITFVNNASLESGWSLSLAVELDAGGFELDSQFQQALNYSFMAGGPLQNDWITVYRKDQLLWGVPPPLSLLPECAFVAGVNLHGPALTIDGHALQASSSAGIAYSGATFDAAAAPALVPVPDASTSTLLRTGFTLSNASATWSVPNGKYWAYAWLNAVGSTNPGQLLLQDNPVDRFSGLPSNGAGWARVGPYAVDVLDGSLKLSRASGTVNLAGIELYDIAP